VRTGHRSTNGEVEVRAMGGDCNISSVSVHGVAYVAVSNDQAQVSMLSIHTIDCDCVVAHRRGGEMIE
jgi:hypothetical protein